MLTTILAVIFVFGLLIIGHEFGHFIMAKLSNIKVSEFSFGMGPRILKFGKGETQYSLRVFPIGGFVKMLGEDEHVNDSRSFSCKTTAVRMSVIAAGPIMNIIISILIFSIISMVSGYKDTVISKYAEPPLNNPSIVYPAKNSGILPGDRIVKANDENILIYDDFRYFMYENGGKTINLTIERNGEKIEKNITPIYDKSDGMYYIGIESVFKKASLFEGIRYGVLNTWSLVKQIGQFFKSLVMGRVSTEDVSGPVGIIKFAGDAARQGFGSLLFFTAFLSVNLAITNLIPFPAMDGGWLLLLMIEGIRRKKLDADKVGIINFIGFALLMILTVLIAFRDFVKFNIF